MPKPKLKIVTRGEAKRYNALLSKMGQGVVKGIVRSFTVAALKDNRFLTVAALKKPLNSCGP